MGFGGYSTKGERFPVEILTSAEVRGLMGACSRRGLCGTRDRSMIALMYRAGLRISEVLGLLPKDVDLVTGAVAVLKAKGGKSRVVAVDPETVALVELWLEKRAGKGISACAPLFCSLGGESLDRRNVTRTLKTLAEKAGIRKRVHPHGLRHSRAFDLAVEQGVDVVTVSHALGHSNVSTTNTYLQHIAPAKVLEVMRGGTW